jgi:inosose dehydratase
MLDVRLAIAPVGWTNDDLPELGGDIPFEQCVSEMALAGFQGTEVGNKYPKDPAVLSRALNLRGLAICNGWFSSFLTTKPLEEVQKEFVAHTDFLHAVGARLVGAGEHGNAIVRSSLPVFDAKPSFSKDEWKRVADGLNKLGELARAKGMQLTYHHHMGTAIQTAEEIDTLMAMTEPGLCDLLYDTGHLAFSGDDYLAVWDKWGHRVNHIHLKDVRSEIVARAKREGWSFLDAVKAGVFTVPGDGSIDFTPVFERIRKACYKGWCVIEAEQDPMIADPLEYAMKGRAYLRDKAGL